MMSLTFGLFTQVCGSGPLGPLVWKLVTVSIIFVMKSPFFMKTKFKQILLIISQNKYLLNEWCIFIVKHSRIQ